VEPSRTARSIGYAGGAFLLVHGLYLGAGVRFDDALLADFWQTLDPVLLRDRLLESLGALHSQPPLFNLFLGVVLKLGEAWPAPVLHAVYLGAGLGLYLALLGLLRRLGVSRPVAVTASTLFMASPAFVLYEHWAFYAFPLTALLTGSAWLLAAALERPTGGRVLAFFGLVAVLCATASPFHLAYYVLVAAGLALGASGRRGIWLRGAAPPLLLLLALYGHHLLWFGAFTTYSWTWMSAAKVTLRHVPRAERARLVAAGALSPLVLITPFSAVEVYPAEYRRVPARYAGIPALAATTKSTGAINYNHAAYLAIAAQYGRDTRYVIRHYPGAVLAGVGTAWLYYFRASTDYPFFGENRAAIRALVVGAEALLGRVPSPIPYALDPRDRSDLYLVLLVGLPLLVGVGLRAALGRNAAGAARSPAQRLVIGYVTFAVVYVAMVANTLEVVENNRFRFLTEPLAVVLLALWVDQLRTRRRAGREAPRLC
jgi:hypothetical protein